MYQRVSRANDRKRYQPAIHSTQIHDLWLVAQAQGQPMTRVLADAIEAYVESFNQQQEERTA